MTTPREKVRPSYSVEWDCQLGAGGMAVVYLGWDLGADRYVAVKLVREEFVTDPHVNGRFIREADISLELTHPNIVPTRALTRIDGRQALILDLVGPSVQELRDTIRGDWDILRCIARDLGLGLRYLATEGVVHRDISAGNCLVDPRGRTRLGDFGLATRYDGRSTPRTACGTWPYIAPERLDGERGTAAVDAFSCGAVLFELATGEVPFGGDREAVTAAQAKGPPRLPQEIPRDLRTVIGGLLELDPRRRLLAGEIDGELVAERAEARERYGTAGRTWLRARCPQVIHPAEYVRQFGGKVAAPRAPRERVRRGWAPKLLAPVGASVATGLGALALWSLSGDRAVPTVPTTEPQTQTPTSAIARTVAPEPAVEGPERARVAVEVEKEPAETTEAPTAPREQMQSGAKKLAEAAARFGRDGRMVNLPGGTLVLSSGSWQEDKLVFRYGIRGDYQLAEVTAFTATGDLEVSFMGQTEGVFEFEGAGLHRARSITLIMEEERGGSFVIEGVSIPR